MFVGHSARGDYPPQLPNELPTEPAAYAPSGESVPLCTKARAPSTVIWRAHAPSTVFGEPVFTHDTPLESNSELYSYGLGYGEALCTELQFVKRKAKSRQSTIACTLLLKRNHSNHEQSFDEIRRLLKKQIKLE